jgi:hypothetical protein
MAHGWRRLAVLGLVAGLVCWLPATAGASPGAATAVSATCSGQLIRDPGFEGGPTGSPWSASIGVISDDPKEPPHSGNWDAWMDGYGTTHTDMLGQSIAIPANCHATLRFWLHIDTAETTTTTAYDRLTMKFGSTTLLSFSNLNHNIGYSEHVVVLSGGFQGPSFTATEDSSLQTSFVLDDITLTLS